MVNAFRVLGVHVLSQCRSESARLFLLVSRAKRAGLVDCGRELRPSQLCLFSAPLILRCPPFVVTHPLVLSFRLQTLPASFHGSSSLFSLSLIHPLFISPLCHSFLLFSSLMFVLLKVILCSLEGN